MKKVSIILFALFLVFSTFAGCKKKNENKETPETPKTPETHTHDWGEVTYTWSSDNLSCTATRVCKGDASHKEEETKTATYKVSVEAECEKEGKGTYTVSFTNEAFASQVKEVSISALEHDWEDATYEWAEDYSSCTATRVCSHDHKHVETETIESTLSQKLPTEDEDGLNTYTVTFQNAAFTSQTEEVSVPSLPTLSKLEFTYHAPETEDDEAYYSVKALNTEISGRVTIPSTYKGESDEEIQVARIDAEGFRNCVEITYVNIPGSIETIGSDYAFAGCEKLETLILNEGIKVIGRRAFQNCYNLKSLYLPASLESTGRQGFQSCQILETVIFAEGSNVSIIESNSFANTILKEIIIPNKVVEIGGNAFYNCKLLEKITIPDTVTKIGTNAFNSCTNLTAINFEGTKEQWSNINLSDGWKDSSLTTIHCSDGDITL